MDKNILIFSLAYYPHVGGAEVAWKEITDRVDNYEFDMIVAKLQSGLPKKEKIGNVNVHRIGFGISIIDKLIYCLYAPIYAYFLNKKRNYKYYIGLMASYGGLASVFYKRFNKKAKYILNLQDGDTDEYIEQKTRFIKGLYKKIYSKADFVTGIATFFEKRAIENGFEGKFQLIPNGVDMERFLNYKKDSKIQSRLISELGLSEEDKVIITTSRLNYKNSIDSIILSLNYLPENYKFVCLGEGEEREKLEKLISDNNLGDRVKLLGYKSHEEMLDYLSIADYFCRPSLQEGLGNSFLEAMAFELPVIATPVGGINDFLFDGKTGFRCKVQDPESIANAVEKFDNLNPKEFDKLIQNAKELAVDKYDWEKISKDYIQLFDTLNK